MLASPFFPCIPFQCPFYHISSILVHAQDDANAGCTQDLVCVISLATQAKPCVTKSWMEPAIAVVDLTLGGSSGASVSRCRR